MRRILKRVRSLTLALAGVGYAAAGGSVPANAWGAQGHQYTGSLGWEILNPRARSQVAALLGPNIDLGEAAVWADCLRSVSGSPGNGYRYVLEQRTPRVCREFDDNGIEEGRITDYAARNWTNCEYSGRRAECNLAYHFANVNVFNRSDYRLGYHGTGPQDVVQAINAAITVLRCGEGQTCPSPSPFSIRDKREALFLLAHFVGDVHQPLHVGAVYLDDQGREVGDEGRSTTGGNNLLLVPGNTRENLHSEWDTILQSFGTAPSMAAVSDACRIAPRPDPAMERPETWATQSVRAARAAYRGMTFVPDATQRRYWNIRFEVADQYARDRKAVQARQLVTAGARLGAVLNAVWPSREPSPSCGSSTSRRTRR